MTKALSAHTEQDCRHGCCVHATGAARWEDRGFQTHVRGKEGLRVWGGGRHVKGGQVTLMPKALASGWRKSLGM